MEINKSDIIACAGGGGKIFDVFAVSPDGFYPKNHCKYRQAL